MTHQNQKTYKVLETVLSHLLRKIKENHKRAKKALRSILREIKYINKKNVLYYKIIFFSFCTFQRIWWFYPHWLPFFPPTPRHVGCFFLSDLLFLAFPSYIPLSSSSSNQRAFFHFITFPLLSPNMPRLPIFFRWCNLLTLAKNIIIDLTLSYA